MITKSINILNLCVPCQCHCRYCLLSWSNSVSGIDYERSEKYAKSFFEWIKHNRPDLNFMFYYGYSMEHPDLFKTIDFFRTIDSPQSSFLQFNGMRFRECKELLLFLQKLKEKGIKLIDLTFYGDQEYHDKFSGRKNDFSYLLSILSVANEIGIDVQIGIPLTHENVNQVDKLILLLSKYKLAKLFLFIPHAEGRGSSLNNIRFTQKDYACLSENAKKYLNTNTYKSEHSWLKDNAFKECKYRTLTLSLTPDNICQMEALSFADTIKYLEELDENYYNSIPTENELINLYGDINNDAFYSQRDLFLKYQRKYIADNNLDIYDITDERQSGSRRY